MKLKSILNAYLGKEILTDAITGGAHDDQDELNDQVFSKRLDKNSQFNHRLIVTFVVILLLSFLLVSYLIWYFMPDKTIVLGLLGGEGLSIILIIKTLHKLYRDKVFTDQLLYLMPRLQSEAERIKYIETLSSYLK